MRLNLAIEKLEEIEAEANKLSKEYEEYLPKQSKELFLIASEINRVRDLLLKDSD